MKKLLILSLLAICTLQLNGMAGGSADNTGLKATEPQCPLIAHRVLDRAEKCNISEAELLHVLYEGNERKWLNRGNMVCYTLHNDTVETDLHVISNKYKNLMHFFLVGNEVRFEGNLAVRNRYDWRANTAENE